MMNTRLKTQITCSSCTSDDLLTVSMTMQDGSVLFWTCAQCEATGWERDGSTLDRHAALANIPRR